MLHLLGLKGGELKKNKEWAAGLSKAAGRKENKETESHKYLEKYFEYLEPKKYKYCISIFLFT